MDPRSFIGNGEAKACTNDIPLMPMHELLEKMTTLSVDIRENARYIDSSMFPANGKTAETFPVDETYCMHDALKRIMNDLVVANDTLLRVRSCL